MKKIFLVAFCSMNLIFIEAQKHEFLNYPKFNDADLSKQKSALDENAPAEILFKSLHFSIDNNTGNLVKKAFYRVKIYDKDKAEDWLNLEIPVEGCCKGFGPDLHPSRPSSLIPPHRYCDNHQPHHSKHARRSHSTCRAFL
jgi:hypothetical protein